MQFGQYYCPPKYRRVRKLLPAAPAILDIGIANHSPSLARRWFPDCRYFGADIRDDHLDAADRRAMEHFYPLTVDGDGYDAIPDGAFDLVVMSHVIEHMPAPMPIVARMCRKLKPGGYIWISFPSMRALELPPDLQFCGDETHVRVVDVKEVANTLLDSGVRIVHAGRTRDALRFALGVVLLPQAYLRYLLTGRMPGRGLCYVLGYEDDVFGRRS